MRTDVEAIWNALFIRRARVYWSFSGQPISLHTVCSDRSCVKNYSIRHWDKLFLPSQVTRVLTPGKSLLEPYTTDAEHCEGSSWALVKAPQTRHSSSTRITCAGWITRSGPGWSRNSDTLLAVGTHRFVTSISLMGRLLADVMTAILNRRWCEHLSDDWPECRCANMAPFN